MSIFTPKLHNLTDFLETTELSSEPLQSLVFSTIIKSIKHSSCRNCKIGTKFPNVFVFLFLIPVISGIGFSHRGKYFFHRGRGIYLALKLLKTLFSASCQAVKKGLDTVNALSRGCAAYPNVRKQSQNKEFDVYQPLSAA